MKIDLLRLVSYRTHACLLFFVNVLLVLISSQGLPRALDSVPSVGITARSSQPK